MMARPVSACRRACIHREFDLHIQLHVSSMMVLVLDWFLGSERGNLVCGANPFPSHKKRRSFSQSLLA